jgi:hypothetical protein
MRQALKLHPDSRTDVVNSVEVEVERTNRGNLVLDFQVTGSITDILLPVKTEPVRTDELWRHTCFEAFVRTNARAGYCEFNFSPATQWAGYRFSGYREGMSPIAELQTMPGRTRIEAGRLRVGFVADLEYLPEFEGGRSGMLGLSAVIEEISGNTSYWALAHPQGKPDFHHADSFTLDLPPPEQT